MRTRKGKQGEPPLHFAALALAKGSQPLDAPQILHSHIQNFAGTAVQLLSGLFQQPARAAQINGGSA
jgi:hypothetical protein